MTNEYHEEAVAVASLQADVQGLQVESVATRKEAADWFSSAAPRAAEMPQVPALIGITPYAVENVRTSGESNAALNRYAAALAGTCVIWRAIRAAGKNLRTPSEHHNPDAREKRA